MQMTILHTHLARPLLWYVSTAGLLHGMACCLASGITADSSEDLTPPGMLMQAV